MTATSSGLLICLGAIEVLYGDQFPPERKLDALRLLRARLPELSTKDADKYYKMLPTIRQRYVRGGSDGDVVRAPGGVEVEVSDAALPDPGLDWSF